MRRAPPGRKRAERTRRIGWLSDTAGVRPTFSEALRELGWVEGRNISFETRNTQGQRERSPEWAKELIAAKVDLIVAVTNIAIRAATQATREIPIVMAWWGGPDLVESGVIASYARPGGNVTGVDMMLSALDAKRLDLLRQITPRATKIAVLVHNPPIDDQLAITAEDGLAKTSKAWHCERAMAAKASS